MMTKDQAVIVVAEAAASIAGQRGPSADEMDEGTVLWSESFDSLDMVELLVELELRTGVGISESALTRTTTVGDLADLLVASAR